MERTPSGFRIEITHGHKYKLRPDARGEDVWTEATACELELWALVQAQERELANWKTWGIVEIAMRNSNVSSYVEHWEGRATSAEVKLQAQRIRETEDALDLDIKLRHVVENKLAGLISAAKARQAYEQRTPKYFGHDCRWCSACYGQLIDMERAAITEAEK